MRIVNHNPCYQCVPPKRQIGCHGSCPEYLAWRKKLDDENKVLASADRSRADYMSYKADKFSHDLRVNSQKAKYKRGHR